MGLLILLVALVIGAIGGAAAYVRYRQTRDPEWDEWETRWRELPLSERKRLARLARRGGTGSDPAEASLISGSARYQRTFGFAQRQSEKALSIVAAVIVLAGLAEGSAVIALGGVALLTFFVWRWRLGQ